MNREEIIRLANTTQEKEMIISSLLEQKVRDFEKYQIQVLKDIDDKLKLYFPEEVINMLDDYIADTKHVLVIETLWIDIWGGHVRVRINPNYNWSVGTIEDSSFNFKPVFIPTTIGALKDCIEKFKSYEYLRNSLEENIEEVYDTLSAWKTEKLNSELEFLNGIQFKDKTVSKKLKVTVIVEEI